MVVGKDFEAMWADIDLNNDNSLHFAVSQYQSSVIAYIFSHMSSLIIPHVSHTIIGVLPLHGRGCAMDEESG